MLYCSECAKKHSWGESPFKSHGPCECCGKNASCSDAKPEKIEINGYATRCADACRRAGEFVESGIFDEDEEEE